MMSAVRGVVPGADMLPVGREASPADFRAIGPASFELGTITPPEAPAPSSPPALPFSYVNAFHLLALRSCTCELGVQLTSSSEPMSVKQHIEVAP